LEKTIRCAIRRLIRNPKELLFFRLSVFGAYPALSEERFGVLPALVTRVAFLIPSHDAEDKCVAQAGAR